MNWAETRRYVWAGQRARLPDWPPGSIVVNLKGHMVRVGRRGKYAQQWWFNPAPKYAERDDWELIGS